MFFFNSKLWEGVIIDDLFTSLVVGGLARLLCLLTVVVVRGVILAIAINSSAAIISTTVSAPPTLSLSLIVPVTAVKPIVTVPSSSLVVRSRFTVTTIGYFNILVRLLPVESHLSLNLFNSALGLYCNLLPLALQARVVLLFEKRSISRELGPTFDLLELSLNFESITQCHEKFVDIVKLLNFSRW